MSLYIGRGELPLLTAAGRAAICASDLCRSAGAGGAYAALRLFDQQRDTLGKKLLWTHSAIEDVGIADILLIAGARGLGSTLALGLPLAPRCLRQVAHRCPPRHRGSCVARCCSRTLLQRSAAILEVQKPLSLKRGDRHRRSGARPPQHPHSTRIVTSLALCRSAPSSFYELRTRKRTPLRECGKPFRSRAVACLAAPRWGPANYVSNGKQAGDAVPALAPPARPPARSKPLKAQPPAPIVHVYRVDGVGIGDQQANFERHRSPGLSGTLAPFLGLPERGSTTPALN